MKRWLIIGAAVVMLLAFSKFELLPMGRELSDIDLILTLGVDRAKDGGVALTASVGSAQYSQGNGNKTGLVRGESETLSGAVAMMQMVADKLLFTGNLEQVLIGETLAGEGLKSFVDFLERDQDMRPGTSVFVVKGSTAEALMEAMDEKNPISGRLKSVEETAQSQSVTEITTVGDLTRQYAQKKSALLPALHIINDEGNREIGVFGYGLFSGDRLMGYLNRQGSQGANIVMGKANYDIVEVLSENGAPVALRVSNYKRKIEPVFDGDRLKAVTVSVELKAAINEVRSDEEIMEKDKIKRLESQLAEAVWKKATDALSAQAELGSDLLGLGRAIEMGEASRWRAAQRLTEDPLKGVPVEVSVKAEIIQSYDLTNPVG